VVTHMETARRTYSTSGAPSARSMLESVALHVLALVLLLIVSATALLHSAPPVKREVDVVFYRPPQIPVPARPVTVPVPRGKSAAGAPLGAPAPALKPKVEAAVGPDGSGKPDLPAGPEEGRPVETPAQKVGQVGILAFRDKFASLTRDRTTPRLGAEARYGAADEVGRASSGSSLTTNSPGSSGGINVNSLNRSVGGGGGGGRGNGSGGGGGMQGVQVGRATSTIAAAGGDDRPKSRSGVGPSRTDEEIQIVFDRYKAAFYRLYNRELRNNPTLQGQMVLRLTIEPDGSVSMCALHSSNMDAPDLASQVVDRVKGINFGAKEGVRTVTITYPIDFLPAA
jgi:hypothetical protein